MVTRILETLVNNPRQLNLLPLNEEFQRIGRCREWESARQLLRLGPWSLVIGPWSSVLGLSVLGLSRLAVDDPVAQRGPELEDGSQ